MNEYAKQWVAALRSGKFQKGVKALKRQRKGGVACYCCLGVACELMANDLEVIVDHAEHTSFDGELAFLPQSAADRYELTSRIGRFEWDSLPEELRCQIQRVADIEVPVTLVGLNDVGVPFDLIADVIEAEPKGLFKSS